MRVVIPIAIIALIACATVPRYAGQILAPPREASAVVVVHSATAAQSSNAASLGGDRAEPRRTFPRQRPH
jgi:hypothetical protein